MPVAYTHHAAFLAALPGPAEVLDFESHTAGTGIASGDTSGGITFTYDLGKVQMAVTDGDRYGGGGPCHTTSGAHFLGTDDGDIFQGGDGFNLSFGPTNAIGIYFITADTMYDDGITLTAGSLTAGIDKTRYFTLADGSQAFFFGITDVSATFTIARISSFTDENGPYFLVNVDDIITTAVMPVPEPATMLLMGSGLLAMAGFRGQVYTLDRLPMVCSSKPPPMTGLWTSVTSSPSIPSGATMPLSFCETEKKRYAAKH